MNALDDLYVLTPDPQAVLEVIQVHEELDPPNSPIYLSVFPEYELVDAE